MHIFSIFLYPFDISPTLFWESTLYFGYNPSLCFKAAHSMAILERMKKDVLSGIRDIAVEETSIPQLLHLAQTGNPDISHAVFQISPKNESQLLAQCNYGAVSQWALDQLLKVSPP